MSILENFTQKFYEGYARFFQEQSCVFLIYKGESLKFKDLKNIFDKSQKDFLIPFGIDNFYCNFRENKFMNYQVVLQKHRLDIPDDLSQYGEKLKQEISDARTGIEQEKEPK